MENVTCASARIQCKKNLEADFTLLASRHSKCAAKKVDLGLGKSTFTKVILTH